MKNQGKVIAIIILVAVAATAVNAEFNKAQDAIRYRQAVMDVNRVLHMAGLPHEAAISLSNYGSTRLSPVRSADLIRAAEAYEANPFHAIFSEQLSAMFSRWEPAVVGMSINFMSQALCAFAMIGWIR